MCNKNKCKCPETCEEINKAKYECYLKEQERLEEEKKKYEDSLPDNSYGINPAVFDQSRDRVYMNYTGSDRLKW